MSSHASTKFAKDLERAGLVVRRKHGAGGHKSDFVVYSPSGQMLGAFGSGIEKGRTKKNILAQIRRAGFNA